MADKMRAVQFGGGDPGGGGACRNLKGKEKELYDRIVEFIDSKRGKSGPTQGRMIVMLESKAKKKKKKAAR